MEIPKKSKLLRFSLLVNVQTRVAAMMHLVLQMLGTCPALVSCSFVATRSVYIVIIAFLYNSVNKVLLESQHAFEVGRVGTGIGHVERHNMFPDGANELLGSLGIFIV